MPVSIKEAGILFLYDYLFMLVNTTNNVSGMLASKQVSLKITDAHLNRGKLIQLITLYNKKISIEITNLGCAIRSIIAPDKKGIKKNIVAGFADLKGYENNEHYFGCIVGRYANRISGGKFSINDNSFPLSVNDGYNHLHGGFEGFHKKIWSLSSVIENETEAGVVFEYYSKDGEEGYPGNLDVKVTYLLNNNNQLSIQYEAKTDKSTTVNLSNHSYFNLTGFETPEIYDHVLHINAKHYTPKNTRNTPDGSIKEVKGTALDFFKPKAIGQDIDQLIEDKGYDHNFILTHHSPGEMILAAELSEMQTGRVVRVFTVKPGLQLYTGNFWNGNIIGSQGFSYVKHGGVALETQSFPDSPNHPHFPNTILHPGELYEANTIYEFSIK